MFLERQPREKNQGCLLVDVIATFFAAVATTPTNTTLSQNNSVETCQYFCNRFLWLLVVAFELLLEFILMTQTSSLSYDLYTSSKYKKRFGFVSICCFDNDDELRALLCPDLLNFGRTLQKRSAFDLDSSLSLPPRTFLPSYIERNDHFNEIDHF